MDKKRDPKETRDIGIKRMIDDYQRTHRTVCPPSKVREFEKHMIEKVLPKVYEQK